MTQEFPNQTSSPLWTSESVRLEKLAWRQELGRRAIARSRMNRVCLMLLIWLAVFSQLSSTGVVLLSFLQLDIPAWLTGVGRLAAACGTVGLVLIWKRRPFWQNVMFARSGVPRAGEVLLWVLCLLALQGAAGLLQSLLSPAMEFFRTKSKVVSGTAETTVSLALYTAVAAPVTEELLFRGAVLRSLQPYGKRFAIFCSALLFGLVHQNLTQTPFAFGFGLLAGYVAVEYSILWSMSLHILNNAVLALGLDALLRPLARKYFTPGTHRTNADRLVGQEAVATETIDNLAGAGQASIGGQIWTARGEDNTPIEAGARVQVLRIEGVKLIVRAEGV